MSKESKANSLASRAGKALGKGARRAGRRALAGSASFVSALPSKIKTIVLLVIVILLFSSAFGITVFWGYYYSGEDGGETGINDIDSKNQARSTMSSESDNNSSSSSSGSSDSSVFSGDATGDGDDVVEYALQYVGNPYIMGGESLTNGCDCSGFTMKVMEYFGVSLPHNAYAQRGYGKQISEEDLAPGDLVFYDNPDHTAIYIGNGQIVHASNSKDGIKVTTDYKYRTVAYCARYVEPGTEVHTSEGGTTENKSKKKSEENTAFNDVTSNYSPANKAYFNFFLDISKNKSVYQIKTDEETGEDILITPDDPDAVSDYFKNDEKFYISPFLLYSINHEIWGDSYAYPEAFLNPVAHDENYNLIDISENNKLAVESVIRTSNGEKTEKKRLSTSDYGLASILKYKEADMVEEYKGTYVKEDYYDTESGKVKQRDINESYSFEITRDTKYVLDWAQTFAGYITYDYLDTSVKTSGVTSGESSNEKDNTEKYLYKVEKVKVYIIVPKSSSNRTSNQICTATSLEAAKNYISKHPGYTIYGATTVDGEIVSAKTTNKSYNLYKYRGSDSGKYTNFVEQSSSKTVDQTNDYLDDYLNHFATYKPTTIDRDPEVFSNFVTVTDNYSTSSKSTTSGGSTSGGGDFDSCWNDETIGEYIRVIWDTALAYGHSEEKAAAILGNMWWESARFNIDAISSDGYNSYGLCQWTGGRKTQLFNFASGYYGENTSGNTCSFESQVEFAMMELDYENSYTWCACQWSTSGTNCGYSHAEMYSNWLSSNDVDLLTTAMCISWERAGEPHIAERQQFAEDAYDFLKGQSFDSALEIIEPSSSNGDSSSSSGNYTHLSNTSSLTDEEKEIYSTFYHEADDIYESGNSFSYYEFGLTKEKREDVLLTASALSRGITKRKARLDLGEELWEEDYILNLTELSNMNSLSKSLDSVDIANATEFLDYDFLWPFAQDATANSGLWLDGTKFSSRYGPRTSPTAGATSNHQGLDIPVLTGTPIVAVSAGTVSYIGDTGGGGYAVYVSHGTNADGQTVESRYFHLKTGSAMVSVGDTVEKGQQIALSNNSGVSTGAHLHLGIAVNGVYYNPLAFYNMSSVPMLTKVGGSVENVDFNSVGSLPGDFKTSYYEYLYIVGSDYKKWSKEE
jgi:Membrane proteins related to metalloendopeptidases